MWMIYDLKFREINVRPSKIQENCIKNPRQFKIETVFFETLISFLISVSKNDDFFIFYFFG